MMDTISELIALLNEADLCFVDFIPELKTRIECYPNGSGVLIVTLGKTEFNYGSWDTPEDIEAEIRGAMERVTHPKNYRSVDK